MNKGFSQIILIIAVILVVLAVAYQPTFQNQQKFSQNSRIFYEKSGVSFEQYWPKDFYAPHMKADETEIQVFNESDKTVQFKSIIVEYLVDGVKTSEKSGTWEKFPSRTSWEKIQYVNIDPAHFRGEPLILNPGEKGKIHHHIELSGKDIPSAKDQKVNINLIFTLDGKEVTLAKELVRDTPPAQGSSPQEDH